MPDAVEPIRQGVQQEAADELTRSAEGWLGIDYPVDAAKLAEPAGEGGRFRQVGEIAEEAEFASRKGGTQLVEKQAPKEPREDVHRQEEPRATGDPSCSVERWSAAGYDAMQVWMKQEVLSPAVQDGKEADFRTEVLGIGRDGFQSLGVGSLSRCPLLLASEMSALPHRVTDGVRGGAPSQSDRFLTGPERG
jgi:hypothetical protein